MAVTKKSFIRMKRSEAVLLTSEIIENSKKTTFVNCRIRYCCTRYLIINVFCNLLTLYFLVLRISDMLLYVVRILFALLVRLRFSLATGF